MESLRALDTNTTPETNIQSYPLLPGEKILSIEDHPLRVYPERPSSVEQLLRLTRSKHIYEIGDNGPSVASLAMPAETVGYEADTEYLHLYEVVFGRDSLRVANFLMTLYPKLTRSTLMTLAKLQGVGFDDAREEEPGGIAHEIRDHTDPIAQRLSAERDWDWPYYGTADATPEFVRTLCEYIAQSSNHQDILRESFVGRDGKERSMHDALDNAIDWIAHRRSLNREGLIEYKAKIPNGIENQAWKDSWDAYHHADGTIANHAGGVASIEIQVAAYDALMDASELYDTVVGNEARATALRMQAAELRKAIFDHFWTEDKGGYFVIGTDRDEDGQLRQMKIRTSNMGHVLNSRLLEGPDIELARKRDAVVSQLLSPEMLARGGVRTLASDEIRYRPGSYHNGSVWLWDSYYIAKGLHRHGYEDAAVDIGRRMLDVVDETRIFPEYIRGEQDIIALNRQTVILWDESANKENCAEQPPQEVQAWTVAAVRDFKDWVWKKDIRISSPVTVA